MNGIFQRSYEVSMPRLIEIIGAESPASNGLHGLYKTEAIFLAEHLLIGGTARRYVFNNKSHREGFRTYISGYGRDVVNSYENGWRFKTRSTLEVNELVLWVWKVKSDVAEKEQRSHPRPRKAK